MKPVLWTTLPEPFKSELLGVSDITGIPLGRVVLYNVFYEIFTVCTSVITQDAKGTLYHARNLDFGLFLGYVSLTSFYCSTLSCRDI